LPSTMIFAGFDVRCLGSFRCSSIGHPPRKRSAWILAVATKYTRAAALFFGGHNRFNAAFFTNESYAVLFSTGYQYAGFFDHLSRAPSTIGRPKNLVCHRSMPWLHPIGGALNLRNTSPQCTHSEAPR
jgi:hypothetical protein